jgi:hypothetical protein
VPFSTPRQANSAGAPFSTPSHSDFRGRRSRRLARRTSGPVTPFARNSASPVADGHPQQPSLPTPGVGAGAGPPTMFFHLVARALPGQAPLAEDAAAWWMLHALRRAWPDALAACVMPSHLHLLLDCVSPSLERAQLARVVGAFSRHVRQARIWRPVETPRPVSDYAHLQRTVRYVHLNPCRSELVDDPLKWPYSTHRGIVGAIVDPWVQADRIRAAIRYRGSAFRAWYHLYVSAERGAAYSRHAALVPSPPKDVPEVPLASIFEAAVAATPWSSKHVQRLTFVQLARHQGWRDTRLMAQALGIGPRHVRCLAREPSAGLLSAAALCLGDPRLRNRPYEASTAETVRAAIRAANFLQP